MTATQNRADPPGPRPNGTGPGGESGRSRIGSKVPRSRMGGAWVTLLTAAFVLLLLLIFILQNSQRAEVSFLGAHGHLPIGVALLLAATFGVLLVALPGTARIIQLRLLNRRRGHNLALQPRPPDPKPPSAEPDTPAGT